MKTKFTDYEDKKELIGKYVIYESGQTYSATTNKSLRKIESVTKTGFRIFGLMECLFDFNGERKGLSGRMSMSIISRCTLLTNEEVDALRIEWAAKKELKALRDAMKVKLETMTLDQLKKMESL